MKRWMGFFTALSLLLLVWTSIPEAQGPGIRLTSGTYDPEGRTLGSPGSMFLRNDGGAGRWYIKRSGTSTAGWEDVFSELAISTQLELAVGDLADDSAEVLQVGDVSSHTFWGSESLWTFGTSLWTGTEQFMDAMHVNITAKPTVVDTVFSGEFRDIKIDATTTVNMAGMNGMFLGTKYSGQGTLGQLFGAYFSTQTDTSGDVAELYGAYAQTAIIASDVGSAYGFYAGGPIFPSTGSLGTHYAFYTAETLESHVTNSYDFWADERGVFRIKADALDGATRVQAIAALYNPRVTKYTPGAANFERGVFGQWVNNVYQIGTEAGGTGTLRNIAFIGGDFEMQGVLTATGGYKSADGTTGFTGTCAAATTATVKNGLITGCS